MFSCPRSSSSPVTGRDRGFQPQKSALRGKGLLFAATLVLGSCESGETLTGPVEGDPLFGVTLAISPVSHDFGAAGEAYQFTVAAVDPDGESVSASSIEWSSENPSVATVEEDGTVTARGAGTTAIHASLAGIVASSTVEVHEGTSPPSSIGSHEPAGYSRITDRPFEARDDAGWGFNESSRYSIETDANAPGSCCRVGQARYNAGYSGGTSPAITWTSFGSEGNNEIYISFWLKLSDNWQGHSSGVNKIGFVWIHDNAAVYFSAQGSGSGTLRPQVRLQDVPDGARNLAANAGNPAVRRGEWQRWEVQLIANSGGQANGVSRLWLDGELVSDYRDVRFSSASQGRTWQHLYWYPVWGGMGDSVQQEMTMSIDHIYASGK